MDFNIELAKGLLDSTEEFPVELDRAWQWLGYSRKDKAEEGLDFSTKRGKSPTGGRPSDSYYLTANCLKEFGMIARTEQGRLIRGYFLECEKIAKQAIEASKLQNHPGPAELPVVMPTEQELNYMRSRAWEKSEMMGHSVSPEKIKQRTGYRRATDIVRDMAERAQQSAISGGAE